MSENFDELYQLLPAIYRIRDSEKKEVLKEYLSILAKQAGLVEEDIARLYDNWFIETCEEWAVPYIGSLLGVRGLHSISEKADFSQRSRVANTLSYRRRKGTASMLEQLAYDSTGWQARVVEFFSLLATTQNINHIRLQNHRTPDIRNSQQMELINSPFDNTAHTADVRHIESRRGCHNIPHIGLYLWRLEAYPVYNAPAFSHKNGQYSFSQLGNDIQLFNNPVTEEELSHLAEETNVPSRIRGRAFYENKGKYYGKDLSICIWVDGSEIPPERYAFKWDDDTELITFLRDILGFSWTNTATVNRWEKKINVISGTDHIEIELNEPKAILRTNTDQLYEFEVKVENSTMILYLDVIVPCDLSDWEHKPHSNQIAVDPILGRIAFPDDDEREVKVTYYYGFSSEIGGGFYDRGDYHEIRPDVSQYIIRKTLPINSIKKAIQQWEGDDKPDALLLIKDSEVYDESLNFEIPAGRTVEIRADNNNRPVIHLKRPLTIKGILPVSSEKGAEISFDGLLITGSSLKVQAGYLGALNIHQCTLVPGMSLKQDGMPRAKEKSSIIVENENSYLEITIDRSITGKLNFDGANRLNIRDSIIDGIKGYALKAPEVTAEIKESTIIGEVSVQEIELASNSIFTDKVTATRKQKGCVRYCYIKKGSETPRQYNCQHGTGIDPWLKPIFADTRYGHPEYARLYLLCPDEILTGADDEAEMGVFHHLMQPQREANLRSSLEEYLRFGLEAGILYADYEEKKEVII